MIRRQLSRPRSTARLPSRLGVTTTLVIAGFGVGVGLVGLGPGAQMAHADDTSGTWPALRGRPDGAASLGRPLPQHAALAVAWRRTLGSGYSGVVGGGGKVYTAWSEAGRDWLGSFAVADGAAGWRIELGPTYTGHDGSHDGPLATPALGGDLVVMLAPRGRLLAVDARRGTLRWEVDLGAEPGVDLPDYGVAASPVIAGEVVVVAVSVSERHAFAGYELATGKRRFTAGGGQVNYQSPIRVELGGRDQVVAVSGQRLFGLAPEDGSVLWSVEHKDEVHGGSYAVPLALGGDRLLVASRSDAYAAVAVTRQVDGTFAAERRWIMNTLGRSYAAPVRRGDTVFGFSGAILTAIDASTGERRWRSRPPGDGWPLVVDDRLVVLTKHGSLHLAPASTTGWSEEAALELFADFAWTAPSLVDGRIVARSLGELAAVDIVAAPHGAGGVVDRATAPGPSTSSTETTSSTTSSAAALSSAATASLARFESTLDAARPTDRAALIDRFLATLPAGPLVDGAGVHFLYRGPGSDLATVSDAVGVGAQQAMRRLADTDLWVWSTTLPANALVSYRFIRDYDQVIADPRNPWIAGEGPRIRSWFAMPGYRRADVFAELTPAQRGGLVEHQVALPAGGNRQFTVWTPPGYARGQDRLPVAYVHYGNEALTLGRMAPVLDHLVSSGKVAPLLVAFITADESTAERELFGDLRDAYTATVADTIVPFVDRTYRTRPERAFRASVGASDAGTGAFAVAFRRPDVFATVGSQSAYMLTSQEVSLVTSIPPAVPYRLRVVIEWSTLDLRGHDEQWDIGAASARLAKALDASGHQLVSAEVHAGHGYESFRTRADWLFGNLFLPAQTAR